MSQEFVRNTLIRLIRDHGRGLADDPRRCEGLLRDLCPADKREVNLLVGAIKEGIPAELQRPPTAGAVERAAAKLEQNLGMAPDAARWAAESWALALDIIKPEAPQKRNAPGQIHDSSTARPAEIRERQEHRPSGAKPTSQTERMGAPSAGGTAPTQKQTPALKHRLFGLLGMGLSIVVMVPVLGSYKEAPILAVVFIGLICVLAFVGGLLMAITGRDKWGDGGHGAAARHSNDEPGGEMW